MRTLVAALVAGVALDQILHTNLIGVAGTVLVVAFAAGLGATADVGHWGWWCIAMAAGLAPWLTVRTSPWLVAPDLLAAALLIALAATGRRGPPRTVGGAVANLWEVVPASAQAPAEAWQVVQCAVPAPGRDLRAVGRGAVVALPVAAALLALLLSGDRLFASLLGVSSAWARFIDVVVVVATGVAWLTLIVVARRPATFQARGQVGRRGRVGGGVRVGTTEALVVLVTMAAVLLSYVASLIAGALGGRRYIERTTGVTYAEYARSGFFQLVGVVALVSMVLLTLRVVIGAPGRRRPTLLSAALAIVVSTVVMVIVAVVRLQTYRSVFGLTMLRFSVTVAAVWLGAVVVLIGAVLIRARWQPFLIAGLVASAFLTLTVVNWLNPEAMVARENIDRIDWAAGAEAGPKGATFDGLYLGTRLSDDAVPALVARLDSLSSDQREALLSRLCARVVVDDGWSWNRARARAEAVLERACPGES